MVYIKCCFSGKLRKNISNFCLLKCLPSMLNVKTYSRLSLSRTRLSRITAYLEVKIWPLFYHRDLPTGNKILWKIGEIVRSNFSSFLQYFQFISNLGVKLHIHSVKVGCSINCFPQFRKSDMPKYGYLEVFHKVPWNSR